MRPFEDLRSEIRKTNKDPATLHEFASFLTSGTSVAVEVEEERVEWGPVQYYSLLDILLREMKSKGIVTSYCAVSQGKWDERTSVIEKTSEAVVTLTHRSTEEVTDDEIIRKWGLEKEVPAEFTLKSWREVQKTFFRLKELFGPDDPLGLPETQVPTGRIVPLEVEGTQLVAPDKKATPTDVFPSKRKEERPSQE